MYELVKVTKECQEIKVIQCDCCNKVISVTNGKPAEDVLFINKSWEQGELKDKNHQFELCQECYLKIINHYDLRVREGATKTIVIS